MELCLAAERRTGERVLMRWWDKSRLNLGQGETGMDTEKDEEGEGEGDNTEEESE